MEVKVLKTSRKKSNESKGNLEHFVIYIQEKYSGPLWHLNKF